MGDFWRWMAGRCRPRHWKTNWSGKSRLEIGEETPPHHHSSLSSVFRLHIPSLPPRAHAHRLYIQILHFYQLINLIRFHFTYSRILSYTCANDSMPAHDLESSTDTNNAEIVPTSSACPHPSSASLPATPPYDSYEPTIVDGETVAVTMPPASDNTAGGMSAAQESSMYSLGPEEDMHKDKVETILENDSDIDIDISHRLRENERRRSESVEDDAQTTLTTPQKESASTTLVNTQLRTPSPSIAPSSPVTRRPVILGSCDHELNKTSEAEPWDFTRKPTATAIPNSLFHPYAKYAGTQQSDRQIYNVAVTVLTVDREQCTVSGYLEICGLTPDHPKLTTFFTGEIIGGPDQRYSFRTKDPTWGASNKTDMTHWARFPAWRPLSPFAKNDLEFAHPIEGGDWWQQEHVFMRWKEHFLVPDYKLRSIQGASFEGFYYICLNQLQGTISGIYFHSKSEK